MLVGGSETTHHTAYMTDLANETLITPLAELCRTTYEYVRVTTITVDHTLSSSNSIIT